MRLKYIYFLMLLAAAMGLVSCNAVDTPKGKLPIDMSAYPVYPDGARRVTTAELETLIKEGRAFVVDVRSQDSFDAGHIPGSTLIPSGQILNHAFELPRDKVIVTYCS